MMMMMMEKIRNSQRGQVGNEGEGLDDGFVHHSGFAERGKKKKSLGAGFGFVFQHLIYFLLYSILHYLSTF